MRNNFKGVIFDLDGTLVDSEIVWHKAEARVMEARGYVYTIKERDLILGLRIDDALEALRKHYEMPDRLDDLIFELNHTMADMVENHVVQQPGAQAMIDWVLEHNLPHAIASSSPQIVIDAIVAHMGWLPHFPIRCSADDEARGKPAPDVYLTAARKLGVAPQDCLAIEDTPSGARAAVAANMTVFVVPDLKYTTPEKFTGIAAHLFRSMEEIHALLRQA